MDRIEYELLDRVAAGDGLPDLGENTDRYLLARLLQLRARGLVSFVGQEGDAVTPGQCRLTADGQALLDSHRRLGGAGELRAAAARDPSARG